MREVVILVAVVVVVAVVVAEAVDAEEGDESLLRDSCYASRW